jgi:hypothetical protein
VASATGYGLPHLGQNLGAPGHSLFGAPHCVQNFGMRDDTGRRRSKQSEERRYTATREPADRVHRIMISVKTYWFRILLTVLSIPSGCSRSPKQRPRSIKTQIDKTIYLLTLFALFGSHSDLAIVCRRLQSNITKVRLQRQ